MTEASVVDKVIYRAAEGDKDIQIRQCSQNGAPNKRLPSDLLTKDCLTAGGSKC